MIQESPDVSYSMPRTWNYLKWTQNFSTSEVTDYKEASPQFEENEPNTTMFVDPRQPSDKAEN